MENSISFERTDSPLKFQAGCPALSRLQQSRSWLCFDLKDGTKIPRSRGEGGADVTDPSNYLDLSEAIQVRNAKKYTGIGYALTEENRIIVVDLDNCLDDNAKPNAAAAEIIETINSFTEISVSGRGVHIFVEGEMPESCPKKFTLQGQKVELLMRKRFVALTGKHLEGTPEEIFERTRELGSLLTQSDSNRPKPRRASQSGGPKGGMVPDAQLMQVIRTYDPKLHKLLKSPWNQAGYPSQSEAVYSAVRRLAQYTRNQDQIDRIVRESTLYTGKWASEKWERLGADMISKAIAECLVRLSEFGLSIRFVEQHGGRLLYCEERKQFYAYQAGRWIASRQIALEKAKQTILSVENDADRVDDEALQDAIKKFARKSETHRVASAVVELSKSSPALNIRFSSFDSPDTTANILNVLNGQLDLRTKQLDRHKRSNLITGISPYNYVPDARYPVFSSFLSSIFNHNRETIAWVQRAFGYCLTGDTSQRIVFICHGSGANGKSTLLEVIASVMGADYAQRAPRDLLVKKRWEGIPNDIARMKSSRLVLASEFDEGERLDSAKVKQLSGREMLAARFMREEFFEFLPQFKLVVATNFRPVVSEHDRAIWSRLRVIPFNVTVSEDEQDRELPTKLKAEAEGILAWLIEGAHRYYQDGLGNCSEVDSATRDYRCDVDTVEKFLTNCFLTLVNDKLPVTPERSVEELMDEGMAGTFDFEKSMTSYTVAAYDLQQAYLLFCDQEGLHPLSKQMLSRSVNERGFVSRRNSDGVSYYGLKLVQKWREKLEYHRERRQTRH